MFDAIYARIRAAFGRDLEPRETGFYEDDEDPRELLERYDAAPKVTTRKWRPKDGDCPECGVAESDWCLEECTLLDDAKR